MYDLRSVDGLSPADIRCVVVLIPLLEGRAELEGRVEVEGRAELEGRVEVEGRAELEGLDGDVGLTPADTGFSVLPATCNPPCPLGLGFVAGASPPPG